MKSLCQVFGHPHFQCQKRYLPDKTEGYCPKCNPHHSLRKGIYDLELLGSNKCPNCHTQLEYPKYFVGYHCNACGQNF